MNEREFDGESLGNLTKSHVWELEKGRSRNPTVNAVWGLARALSVSPAALLGLDDAMPPIHPLALEIAGMVDRALRTTEDVTQHAGEPREAPATEPSPNQPSRYIEVGG